MKTKIFLFYFLISSSSSLFAGTFDPEDLVGHWDGYSVYKKSPLYFSIDFYKDSTLYAFFNSEEQRTLNIPLNNVKATRDTVSFELKTGSDEWKFKAYYYHNKASGKVEKGELSADFQLERGDTPDTVYTVRDTTFHNGDVFLSGTVFIPDGRGPFPGIVFMPGSGDDGRFSNFYLADYFAKKGYVSLIYDKRGVNKSTGNWHTSNYMDLAYDCIAGVKLVKSLSNVVNNKVGIYGQSEAGSVCPLIMVLYPGTAFTISAASSGVTIQESDMYAARNRLSKHISGDALELALSLIKLQTDYAMTGEGWDKIEDASVRYSGTAWYDDFVKLPPKDDWWYHYYNKIGNYSPVDFWKKVEQPVLILKGDHDQVSPGYPTFQNIEEALKLAGNKSYKIVFFLNSDHEFHVLDRSNEFWLKGTPNYCETIDDWLNKNKFAPDKQALKPVKVPNGEEEEEEEEGK